MQDAASDMMMAIVIVVTTLMTLCSESARSRPLGVGLYTPNRQQDMAVGGRGAAVPCIWGEILYRVKMMQLYNSLTRNLQGHI